MLSDLYVAFVKKMNKRRINKISKEITAFVSHDYNKESNISIMLQQEGSHDLANEVEYSEKTNKNINYQLRVSQSNEYSKTYSLLSKDEGDEILSLVQEKLINKVNACDEALNKISEIVQKNIQ